VRTPLCKFFKNFGSEKFADGLGRYREAFIVYGNAYALLTFAHAERTAKLYGILQIIHTDLVLELLHHLTRAFQVA